MSLLNSTDPAAPAGSSNVTWQVDPVTGGVSAYLAQPQPAAATPLVDGTATVGTSVLYARQDHVHPHDTTLAPLASPALTGTPTAPTAATTVNSTQIASTAFVRAQYGGTQSSARIAGATGAGTSPTLNSTGIDAAHQLSVLTGTSPAASAAICTVTYSNAKPHTGYPVISPANAAAAAVMANIYISAESTTAYTVSVGATALTAATTYLWNVNSV